MAMEREESKFTRQLWISAWTTQNYNFKTPARFRASDKVRWGYQRPVKKFIEVARNKITHNTKKHYVGTLQRNTTKVRIAYDVPAKSKKSKLNLNECLYRGPFILDGLYGLLMRFGTKRIASTADIEKAFLQVGLNEADRDVTRFLWVKDIKKPPVTTNLHVYRFTRVLFGIILSLSLIESTVKHHFESIGTPVTTRSP